MQLNFDARSVEPEQALDLLPVGWYPLAIDQSEPKPTKGGDGHYIELRFNVLEGQYAGRKVFTRLNIDNKNPQTVEIAFKQLSAICHATGVLQLQDTSQLHGIPLMGKVKISKGTGNYEDSNELAGYKPIGERATLAGPSVGAGAPTGLPSFPAATPTAPVMPPAFTPPVAAPTTPAFPAVPPQQPWAQPPAAPAVAPATPPVFAPPANPMAPPVAPPSFAPPSAPPAFVPPVPPQMVPPPNPQTAIPPWAKR